MAKVFIEETTLTAIGDAIRGKTGKTDLIDPANMSTEIAGIEAGGGPELPESAFKLSGTQSYRFYQGGWDWFIKQFGNKVSTQDLNSCNSMFYGTLVKEIPFQFNMKPGTGHNLNAMFQLCSYLEVCPKIRGISTINTSTDFNNMLVNNQMLRSIEDLFLPEELEPFAQFKCTSAYSIAKPCNIYSMSSLRTVPSWWYKFKLNEESPASPSYMYSIYYQLGSSCYVLDEIVNAPVWTCQGAQTSNMFQSAFSQAYRLKAFTFETNIDGTPKVAKWKNQIIDLQYTGYVNNYTYASYITKFNTGITKDKEVTDDASYQALKNDPDWYTGYTTLEETITYSRYNHDSAVETINSLPDTSAYLATAGGTNTIKFKGAAGSKTDGGAINTLTEEEIAVATAKGWTVTLS